MKELNRDCTRVSTGTSGSTVPAKTKSLFKGVGFGLFLGIIARAGIRMGGSNPFAYGSRGTGDSGTHK